MKYKVVVQELNRTNFKGRIQTHIFYIKIPISMQNSKTILMCTILFFFSGLVFSQTTELTSANISGGFTGFASFQYSNGDIYSGNWLEGKKHGDGIYTFKNGIPNKEQSIFSGFYGYLEKTAILYEGDWKNDKADGKGTMKYRNTKSNISSIYVGDWKNGDFHGQGKLTFSTGNFYDGSWVEGFKMGAATVYTRYWDGELYEGETFNNDRRGFGKLTYPNGDMYLGEMNVHPNGKGTMTYADGSTATGVFKNGKYVSHD